LVAIPLRGKTASLNVAVAAGVGLFTYANRRNGVGGK
jgi:tRNA G18 (ribose-2'-O)-methylase SpoU